MIDNKISIIGTLYEKGEARFVGEKGTHRVQQFVISFQNEFGPVQYRFMEACKSAVDDLVMIKIGETIECKGVIKGKMRIDVAKSESMWKRFNNLDEINEIRHIED